MFEFHWNLPSSTRGHQLRLQIHARSGWIGRKALLLDDERLYSRRWFAGIDHTFPHPDDPGRSLELRAVEVPESKLWTPQLRCDGALVPEITGAAPPPVADRPKVVSIVVGLTYLVMFMMLVMLQHIPKMLDAAFGHSDIRTYVLAVDRRAANQGGPRLQRGQPPRATLNEPYEARLTARGGTPPYRWERIEGRMPVGLKLERATGTIRGTPAEPGDRAIRLRVTDQGSARADWRYVISVKGPRPGYPRIETEMLPDAQHGRPYAAPLRVAGGQPPYRWVVNERKLPRGLRFEVDTAGGQAPGASARLAGTPRAETALLFGVDADADLERELDNGALPSALRQEFSNDGVPLSERPAVSVEQPGRRWLVADQGRCFSIVKEGPKQGEAKLHAYETAGAFALEFRVTDATYSPSGDIWPWVLPSAATAICLLGFWNMRRWSVAVYAGLICAQVLLGLAVAGYPVSIPAVILQVLLWGVGAAYWRGMY